MTRENLLVELFVEELPPKALQKLNQAFAQGLAQGLQLQGLLNIDSEIKPYATPRRLAVHITNVLGQAADKEVSQKLMPVSVGLKDGQASAALLKKMKALGLDETDVAKLRHAGEGKQETLYFDSLQIGVKLQQGLQKVLINTIEHLPIPKVMTYQLETGVDLPGWDSVQFVRPAHSLLVLHAERVIDVTALGLQSSNLTYGHRFHATVNPITIKHADSYAQQLAQEGFVIVDYAQRKQLIVDQLQNAAQRVGRHIQAIEDEDLLNEVNSLVEYPNVLICKFETEFLTVPQECLILTMKANQKYFPLLQLDGSLTNYFLVVSNIRPDDARAIIEGNERVVRARLADAKFFFDNDRKKPLQSRLPQLEKVVYHNKLGSQAKRVERVRTIAAELARMMGVDAKQVDDAAQLAKADLLTDMVGEFPELQGVMGRYYALYDQWPEAVADAIEDHYKPRFSGDALPRNPVGVVLALADKLETLVGMFCIGNTPTGDKDPFALRRQALGVIRMLIEQAPQLDLNEVLETTYTVFVIKNVPEQTMLLDARSALREFIDERLTGNLREQGFSILEIDAVLANRPSRLADISKKLAAVRAFNALPEAQSLAAANKRVGNILKKSIDVVQQAHIKPELLKEDAEQALYKVLEEVAPKALRAYEAADYTQSLQELAALKTPVDRFFDSVMVNAEDASLKANRLSLLKRLELEMNRVADLSRLAV